MKGNFEVPKSWRLEKGKPVSTRKFMYSKHFENSEARGSPS